MELSELLTRAIDRSGPVYKPYVLDGNWPPEERERVETFLNERVPSPVDASYNNFSITWTPCEYKFDKATWYYPRRFDSLSELMTWLEKYFMVPKR